MNDYYAQALRRLLDVKCKLHNYINYHCAQASRGLLKLTFYYDEDVHNYETLMFNLNMH